MLRRILLGAAVGAVATVPQSAVVWGGRRAGVYKSTPPPEQVTAAVADATAGEENVPDEWWRPLVGVAHFGYGAACGAAFGLVTGVLRPTWVAGVLAGLAVWKASYDGWLPATGIMPPPEEDEQGRVATMIAAHVVFGLAMGVLMEQIEHRDGLLQA